MINRKSTFFLGIFIFLVPFLGVPTSWKTFFIVVSGLTIVALSIKITLPKKTAVRRVRKEKVTPVYVESIPIYPKENMVDNVVKPEQSMEANATENSVDQNGIK